MIIKLREHFDVYSKIMDDCIICIVHQCNSGNLSWVKLTLLFLQCKKKVTLIKYNDVISGLGVTYWIVLCLVAVVTKLARALYCNSSTSAMYKMDAHVSQSCHNH